MDEFKKQCKNGPGGYYCPCCGPSPKERPSVRRLARTRLKQKLRKEIKENEKAEGDNNDV